jgi:hypothetical protein
MVVFLTSFPLRFYSEGGGATIYGGQYGLESSAVMFITAPKGAGETSQMASRTVSVGW